MGHLQRSRVSPDSSRADLAAGRTIPTRESDFVREAERNLLVALRRELKKFYQRTGCVIEDVDVKMVTICEYGVGDKIMFPGSVKVKTRGSFD